MTQLNLTFDSKTETNFLMSSLVEAVRKARNAKKKQTALLELFVYMCPFILSSVSRRIKPSDQPDYVSELWLSWEHWIDLYLNMYNRRIAKGEKTMGLMIYLRGRTISLSNQLNSKYRLAISVSRDSYVSLAQKASGQEIGNKHGKKMLEGICDNDDGEVCVGVEQLQYVNDDRDVYAELEFNDCCDYLQKKLGSAVVSAAKLVIRADGDGDTLAGASEKYGVSVRSITTVIQALKVLLK